MLIDLSPMKVYSFPLSEKYALLKCERHRSRSDQTAYDPFGEKISFGFAPRRGTDQSVHPCSLIRVYAGHFLDSQGSTVF